MCILYCENERKFFMANPKYKRILLKLSGEALADKNGILDFEFIASVADVLKK